MSTPDDLTRAAHAVVRRVGLGALTLAAVAKEAGISRATLYRRFASRKQLIDAMVAAELDDLEQLMLRRIRFADEPRDTIRMLVREVLDHLENHEALRAALVIDGSSLAPWLIRRPGHPTLIDVVTERVLTHVHDTPLAADLKLDVPAAVELMVSAIFAQMLSPARYLTHALLATAVADAIVDDSRT